MRQNWSAYQRKQRLQRSHLRLAPRTMLRHDALVATKRPHTKTYPEEARELLGVAVARAREAAGHRYRPSFVAQLQNVSMRSLIKLENGEPVGPGVYEEVARHLPSWTEDTPVSILEGGPIPTATDPGKSKDVDTPLTDDPDAPEVARWSARRLTDAVLLIEEVKGPEVAAEYLQRAWEIRAEWAKRARTSREASRDAG